MISRIFLTRPVFDCRRACSLFAGILVAFAAEAAPEIAVICNGFTIADPNDRGMLDVVGFDTTVPAVIADFVRS